MPDPTPSSSRGRRGSRQKGRRRKMLIALAVLGVLALAGAGAWSGFKAWRQTRTVERAQNFLAKKDYPQAEMSAIYALQLNKNDVAAARVMAEAAAAQGRNSQIAWRAKLVEMQPAVLEHRLAWANAALHFGDAATAEKALAGATDAQKKGAAYHAVAARLAATLRQSKATEASVAETVRLEPGNELYQLQLAALRLGAEKPETRDLARSEIEQLASLGKVSRPALNVLIRDALLHGEPDRALGFAQKLNSSDNVTFADRMTYLRLLQQLNRREFWWCLAQMQQEALDSDLEIPTLMTYLNKAGQPKATVEWNKRLPETVRAQQLIPVAMAEACLMLEDWEALLSYVKFPGWGSLEFQRLALLARVLREQGDEGGATANWKAAVSATVGHPGDLVTLARLATAWKWEPEANAILWSIARGPSGQMPALQSLNRTYQLAGETREMLNVANRMVEIDSKNVPAKNNVAYLSLLLEVDKERAHALAREAYATDPKNPSYVSTYALALHLFGKSSEGLKLLQGLPPKELEKPGNAFCYGVLLAALEKREEAPKYLAIAETSVLLLPQEKALVAKAREWLAKP